MREHRIENRKYGNIKKHNTMVSSRPFLNCLPVMKIFGHFWPFKLKKNYIFEPGNTALNPPHGMITGDTANNGNKENSFVIL